MMDTIKITDYLGDEWEFYGPRFRQQANGYWKMWVWVLKGAPRLTTGAYRYQEIPLPVFTDWWPDE